MLLCDIGNSFAKFYDGKELKRIPITQIKQYRRQKVCFINVNPKVEKLLEEFENWINLEQYITLDTSYKGLGVDRKALCWGVEEGVIVDAGSAITVDVMEKGRHKGGFIIPGIRFLQRDFAEISSRLAIDTLQEVDLTHLPQNTLSAISYGIIKPIVLAIKQFDMRIYITGGDGELLHHYIPEALYDPLLLFKHLEKLVQRKGLC
ncbi:type III pantothenate kinase [Nitratiruptor sp. YY08-26]|uniref:type III pantothenate kinase n=1 Tax=unclassified Nitratiruptor TaxID=2624044 RepID=UPI001914FC2A|nr:MULTISPECIES: type III pantothenate kinase [unclassified Nitratiruptor]BCD65874.1 type III pantothenate kinase [Nitratiruptor sp. YY08-26]